MDVVSTTDAHVVVYKGVAHVIQLVGLDGIFDTVVVDGSSQMFADAIIKTGIIDVLKGSGPFTIFARTYEAFAATAKVIGATAARFLARDDVGSVPNITPAIVPRGRNQVTFAWGPWRPLLVSYGVQWPRSL